MIGATGIQAPEAVRSRRVDPCGRPEALQYPSSDSNVRFDPPDGRKAEVCGIDCGKSATRGGNDLSVPRFTHVNMAREHPDAQEARHLGNVGQIYFGGESR